MLPFDADDIAEPEMVERYLAALQEDPRIAYATSWSAFVDEHGEPWPGGDGYEPLGNASRLLAEQNVAGGCVSLFPRRLFERGFGFDPELASYEDWDLFRELAAAGLYGRVIPERLYRYRVRRPLDAPRAGCHREGQARDPDAGARARAEGEVDGLDPDHVERLRLDEVRAPTLIASEHLHRYELAARLCDGMRVADVCCGTGYGTRILAEGGADALGVDSSAEAIEEARAGAGGVGEARFELADALEYLERPLAGELDAVVMFEGLEHLPDLERAVAALRALAAAGVRLAVSIPNSELLGEQDNPFHETDFGHERAVATLESLGDDVTVLGQYLAEGSLIRAEGGGELEARPVLEGRAEPELASHYVGLVGFGADAAAVSARMLLAAAPANRSYMLELEAANGRLWDRIGELEARLERIESSLPYRASAPLRALRRRR